MCVSFSLVDSSISISLFLSLFVVSFSHSQPNFHFRIFRSFFIIYIFYVFIHVSLFVKKKNISPINTKSEHSFIFPTAIFNQLSPKLFTPLNFSSDWFFSRGSVHLPRILQFTEFINSMEAYFLPLFSKKLLNSLEHLKKRHTFLMRFPGIMDHFKQNRNFDAHQKNLKFFLLSN